MCQIINLAPNWSQNHLNIIKNWHYHPQRAVLVDARARAGCPGGLLRHRHVRLRRRTLHRAQGGGRSRVARCRGVEFWTCLVEIQGVPAGRGPWLGWLRFREFPRLVGRYCTLPTAQAGWWYIPNLSQPNQGPRPAGTPCTLVDNLTH